MSDDSCSDKRSHPQATRIGRFAQLDFAEAFAAGVVEEDAVFVAGPDGIVLMKTRPLHVNEETARFAAADDDAVGDGRLIRVEMVLFAENVMDVFEKQFHSRQTMNLVHKESIRVWVKDRRTIE